MKAETANSPTFKDLALPQIGEKGGEHLYFRQTAVSRRLGNKSGRGLFDLRGKNEYVVGPGSQLRLEDGQIKSYTILSEAEIADFRDWLEDWITNHSSSKPGVAGDRDDDSYARLKAAYLSVRSSNIEGLAASHAVPCRRRLDVRQPHTS